MDLLKQQQHEIELGRKSGIDTTIYADPRFDWLQMRELRVGLEKKLDVAVYADYTIGYAVMKQIRKGLEIGINLKKYYEQGYPYLVLREIRKAWECSVDISEYVKSGFDYMQLEEIKDALIDNIDMKEYLERGFSGSQLSEIRLGLNEQLDVSIYAYGEYNWMQMREIRLGLKSKVDVDWYLNEFFSSRQMRQIRKGLEEGLDVSSYAQLQYSESDMISRLNWLKEKIDVGQVEPAIIEHQDYSVVEDMSRFIKCKMDAERMTAQINISPQVDSARLSVDVVVEILKLNEIVLGIDKKLIEDIIARKRFGQSIVIAKGHPLTEGHDGYYKYSFPDDDNKPKVLENGAVDFTNVNPFVIVQERAVVATYQHAVHGAYGYKVDGTMLVPKQVKDIPRLHGRGIKQLPDEDTYIAEYAGRLVDCQSTRMYIDKVYIHSGDYTRSMGKLDFNGDVLIKGNVTNGSVIKATGSIVINGTVESADISAGTTILIKNGVCADDSGNIRSGGDIQSKFFERCNVYAGGSISANSILNSNIVSMESITVFGKRGVIIGGKVKAVQRITVNSLGNPANVLTELEIGLIPEVRIIITNKQQNLEKRKREVKELTAALDKIDKTYGVSESTYNIRTKIQEEVTAQRHIINEITNEINALYDRCGRYTGTNQVAVQGTVYPNVKITVGDKFIKTNSEARYMGVRIKDNNIVFGRLK